MTATFQLDGQVFMALNGGPHFKFTEAISLFVDCETQEEVDELRTSFPMAGKGTMRLAEGQVRSVLAGGSHRFDRNAARRRRGEIGACHAGDDENG